MWSHGIGSVICVYIPSQSSRLVTYVHLHHGSRLVTCVNLPYEEGGLKNRLFLLFSSLLVFHPQTQPSSSTVHVLISDL